MDRDTYESDEFITEDEADQTDEDDLTDEADMKDGLEVSDEESTDEDDWRRATKRRRLETPQESTVDLPSTSGAQELTLDRPSTSASQESTLDIPSMSTAIRDHPTTSSNLFKTSTCPVDGCTGRSKHLKHHAWEHHIPRVFWDRPLNNLNALPAYHRLRASCLDTLAKHFRGPEGNVHDLVDHVNAEIKLQRTYPIIPRTLHQMGQLIRTMWWPRVDNFEMLPINSPAVLIHWRILLALFCTMSPEKRSEFQSLGHEEVLQLEERVKSRRRASEHEDKPEKKEEEMTDDEWTVVDECWGDDEEDSSYEVVVLKEGYSVPMAEQNKVRTGGSITLLKGPMTIIVDTGHPKDKDILLEGLGRNGVTVEEVECCVCTHGHIDNMGNLNVFPDAVYITFTDMCLGDVHHLHDFQSGKPFPLDDDVDVIPTPGHTHADLSVVVRNTAFGTVAIVGNLFHSEDDLEDNTLWSRRSVDPDRQESSRNQILQMVDYIVPGHGKMFKVPA